ncbi:hypothetical protein CFAL_11950 (plasmid) [Corynebacterium falsenii DSM 44353]|uniref:hypothetical protein n=1 Tax=Corynebacterium falsenii TaxID=108486 RepID=UPI0003E9325A|nr:hypothetical protein [Corynebacterium falsenii]AHI04389.1 hypothetical protein CFAL_09775 [Corynebacterium falsenii DSM 44353]AHI04467.1 hypothetical protein CFAL_11950 [Corynebacterium falsenii DSM 44353]UBI04599.1 hypothetical protein LA343_11610 [Corynebacterium falsenii]
MKPKIRRGTFGRWTVHEPDGTQTQFRDFAQAVEHADEIARTITVTLPPYQPWVATGDLELFFGGGHATINNLTDPRKSIWIKPEDATPIALALLATAHYRERRNQ